MKHSLTVVYITCRPEPEIDWFLDSLCRQIKPEDHVEVQIVNSFYQPKPSVYDRIHALPEKHRSLKRLFECAPKPNVWQGEHRLTQTDYWAISTARNTGICQCRTEWIAFVDDRCVLSPLWLNSLREAMDGNYVVCGSYEKRHGMKVENGGIVENGVITGKDCRDSGQNRAVSCPGQWMFGCTSALPLEWALAVNGFEELCDGLGMEDVIFGMNLVNAGYPLKYDPRMKTIEDRTPEHFGIMPKRTAKNRYPNDKEAKDHKALARFSHGKHAQHHWDLRQVRESVLAGHPFPIPDQPVSDWFDAQPISEFE